MRSVRVASLAIGALLAVAADVHASPREDQPAADLTEDETTGSPDATIDSTSDSLGVGVTIGTGGRPQPTQPHQPPGPATGGGEQHDGGSDGGEIEWVASAISELIGPAIDADPICIGVANNPNCYVIPELTNDDIDIAGVPEGQVSGPPADPAPAEAPYVPSPAEIEATILAAYDAVNYPDLTLHTAPPGDLDAPLITQLATFLWVDPAQWQPISASASIPGHLTVTATATPTTMWWSGAETGPIQCYPPGIPWHPGAPEECTMTYKTSSATNDHVLELTVVWEVTYTCSAYCGSGSLDPITRVDTRPVRVAEIQSIVTSAG